MFRILAIAIAVVIAGILLLATTVPDSFRFHRTASIKSPPERIFALINDLHRFNT